MTESSNSASLEIIRLKQQIAQMRGALEKASDHLHKGWENDALDIIDAALASVPAPVDHINSSSELRECPSPWCKPENRRGRYTDASRPEQTFIACECGLKGPYADTREQAIAAWNRRPSPPQPTQEQERGEAE